MGKPGDHALETSCGSVRVRSRSAASADGPRSDWDSGTVFEIFIPDDPGLKSNDSGLKSTLTSVAD